MVEKSISNQVSLYSPSITDKVIQPIKIGKECWYGRGKGEAAFPKLDVCLNSKDDDRKTILWKFWCHDIDQQDNAWNCSSVTTDRPAILYPFVNIDLPVDGVMDPPTALLDADSTPFRF